LLDSETAQRLELVSSIHQPGGPSLMSSVNYCQTSAGSRLLRSNILEPLTDRNKINQRLDAIEEMTSRPSDLLDPIKVCNFNLIHEQRTYFNSILLDRAFWRDLLTWTGQLISASSFQIIHL
jgi:DNA mismatch repair ATPase MutS